MNEKNELDGERARPCPAAGIMGEHACANRDQCWEPCGELGNDPKHVRVASEKDTAAINKALGLSSPPSPLGDTPPDYQKLYDELLYAVGMKWPGETRHQTALRYIQRAEQGSSNEPAKACVGDTPEQQEQKR